jgi:hypothetical protein
VGRPRKHEVPDPPCLRFILPVSVYAARSRDPLIRPAEDSDPGVECDTIIWVSDGKPEPGVSPDILKRAEERSKLLAESKRPNVMNWIENPVRRPKRVRGPNKNPNGIKRGPGGRRDDVTPELCRSLVAMGLSGNQIAKKLGVSRKTICVRLKEQL